MFKKVLKKAPVHSTQCAPVRDDGDRLLALMTDFDLSYDEALGVLRADDSWGWGGRLGEADSDAAQGRMPTLAPPWSAEKLASRQAFADAPREVS